MDSISSGLMSTEAPPLSIPPYRDADELLLSLKGTPSTTHNGWLLSVRELFPRIVILVEPLRPVPDMFICIPATFPCRAPVTEGSPVLFSSSPFSSCIEYPNIFFSRLIPKAVTTTSSIAWASSLRLIFKFPSEEIECSSVLKPT